MKASNMMIGPMMMAGLMGCMAGAEQASDAAGTTGVVQLTLTAVDSQGQQYRLRNATFEITGWSYVDVSWFGGGAGAAGGYAEDAGSPPYWGTGGSGGYAEDAGMPEAGSGGYANGWFSTTVSSETDPDAPVITTRVAPGDYYVTLLNYDWYLERLTPQGPERVMQAVLLSPRSEYVYVWHGGVSEVIFRFGVDGEYLDFRSGEIVIGIEIERPGATGAGGAAGMPVACFGGMEGGGTGGSGGIGGAGGGVAGASGGNPGRGRSNR